MAFCGADATSLISLLLGLLSKQVVNSVTVLVVQSVDKLSENCLI